MIKDNYHPLQKCRNLKCVSLLDWSYFSTFKSMPFSWMLNALLRGTKHHEIVDVFQVRRGFHLSSTLRYWFWSLFYKFKVLLFACEVVCAHMRLCCRSMARGYQAAHPRPSQVTGQRPPTRETSHLIWQQYMHLKARKSIRIPCAPLEFGFDLHCACGLRFLFESEMKVEKVAR